MQLIMSETYEMKHIILKLWVELEDILGFGQQSWHKVTVTVTAFILFLSCSLLTSIWPQPSIFRCLYCHLHHLLLWFSSIFLWISAYLSCNLHQWHKSFFLLHELLQCKAIPTFDSIYLRVWGCICRITLWRGEIHKNKLPQDVLCWPLH